MHVKKPGRFWVPQHVPGLSNLVVPSVPKKNEVKSKDQKTVNHPKLEVKSIVNASVKTQTGPLRVVHLDLKGAAPKISYFQQVRELRNLILP